MIWFFQRESDRLHYEIRRHAASPEFELVITYPDGSELVERFEDADGLAHRSRLLRSELFERGWRSLGEPFPRAPAAAK